jgi:DNA ligase-1
MSAIKSPMLAKDYDPNTLVFPCLGSPKMDGYRAHIVDGVIMSRSAKPINNKFIQATLGLSKLTGLDGELVVGAWSDQETFTRTSSGVKKGSGEPNFKFYVFDIHNQPELPYSVRLGALEKLVNLLSVDLQKYIKVVPQQVLVDMEALDNFESEMLQEGFEGIIVRSINGHYKFGRSTVAEGLLLKVKRFAHEEATVTGFEELMHNGNEAFTNELGRTSRSSHKENLVPSGMIGAYIVKSPKYSKPFRVSCGSMKHDERRERWEKRHLDLGGLLRFKHLPHGAKDVPRHGLYAGFRDPDDLS